MAVERDRVVAAAHLRRYGHDDRVSVGDRNACGIVRLLCWPNHLDAGREGRDASIDHLMSWGVQVHYAGGTLPCPAVFGVSDG